MKANAFSIVRKSSAVLLMGALSQACHAAPPPQYAAPAAVVVGNDGYVLVDNSPSGSGELVPRFCPPRSSSGQGSEECNIDRKVVPPVAAQLTLDLRFGAHKAVVVGVAPFTW